MDETLGIVEVKFHVVDELHNGRARFGVDIRWRVCNDGELRVGLQEGKDGVVGDGRFPRVGNRRDAVFRVYGRGGDAVRTGRTWGKTAVFHP